jgi:signal transduction histidine kinase
MIVPLLIAGRALGSVCFVSSGRPYDTDDLALAENIAMRVAAALENARLYGLACEASRARDDLLLLTAHELRTPLTALQLATQRLQRGTSNRTDGNGAASVDDIARQVQRVSAIVDHGVDASAIRADGVRLVRGPCDLAAIVRDRVDRVARRAERAGSHIAVIVPPSIPGWWDRARLETVIDGLLDNAIKFGAGRPITATMRSEDGSMELSIHDEGIGIPAHGVSTIFEPFERAVPKEHFGGLGLGLYMARAIVQAHGGSIKVTSEPGQGTTFVVRLPVSGSAAARAGRHRRD